MASTATPDPASLKPPAGVLLPPREIRNIIERTAGYTLRNGPDFLNRILQNNGKDPKFCFIRQDDPYHPYFQWRLSEIKAGREVDQDGKLRGTNAGVKEPEKPKGPPEPPAFHFSARMPNISAQDLDVVRLTALFVAKNGNGWKTQLLQRESNNYQFDFLRPQHSLYQYFSRLVDQYTELLLGDSVDGGKPQQEKIAQLKENINNKFNVLGRAKQRSEWVKYQEATKQKKEEDELAEKKAFAEIDWHDFKVLNTIEFTEADETDPSLAPPTSKADVQTRSLEQKGASNLGLRIEEAAPDDSIYTQIPTPTPSIPTPAPYAPSPPAHTAQAAYPPPAPAPQEDEESQRIRERAEARERAHQAQAAAKGTTGPVRIRSDYVPRAQAKRQTVQLALCPNCHQKIPYNELEEHMRIELLDPRWKEQKAKAESRYATTNLAPAEFANNLKRLASHRDDVFDGVTGQPISEEEAARRKRAATSYDGTLESKDAMRMQQMQTMNIEEQIRQIQGKYKQG